MIIIIKLIYIKIQIQIKYNIKMQRKKDLIVKQPFNNNNFNYNNFKYNNNYFNNNK